MSSAAVAGLQRRTVPVPEPPEGQTATERASSGPTFLEGERLASRDRPATQDGACPPSHLRATFRSVESGSIDGAPTLAVLCVGLARSHQPEGGKDDRQSRNDSSVHGSFLLQNVAFTGAARSKASSGRRG